MQAKTLVTLNNQLAKMKKDYENRKDIYRFRRQDWQESELGENFQTRTDELYEILSGLEEIIEDFERWLDKETDHLEN